MKVFRKRTGGEGLAATFSRDSKEVSMRGACP
jgi:hypothetical protein